MTIDTAHLEERRLALQAELDSARNQADRNRMGQFATPTKLAVDILRYAGAHLGTSGSVRFIDPAIGTGAFYSALLGEFQGSRVAYAAGYEIDPHYGRPARRLWTDAGLDIRLQDFTRADPPRESERFNLLICNPPYVRHHHISSSDKQRLQARTRAVCGVEINGLAGLYCYFLGLCHDWMADGGLAGWLIPSEFMDVNYGAAVKRYLLDKVTLLHIHRFDPNDVQFGDALVSSAVVWFERKNPPRDHKVRFTYGGSIQHPNQDRMVSVATLRRDPKWTRYPMKERHEETTVPVLSDFFEIKRGIATGDNRFFILPIEEIARRGMPLRMFRPILPSPRYLPTDEVAADNDGNPILERRLFLLNCRLPEREVEQRYPTVWTYLEEGRTQGVAERYLSRHRTPWYAQEDRSAAPFMCTYLGRGDKRNGRPFRFILNHSQATAANVYLLLYPRMSVREALKDAPGWERRVWKFLNNISTETLLGEGRVYGGGLHKLEPKELGNVPAAEIADLLPALSRPVRELQGELFDSSSI